MKIGQEYVYYNKKGCPVKRIWIESVLDMERYFTKNIFDLDEETPLFKEEMFSHISKNLEFRDAYLLRNIMKGEFYKIVRLLNRASSNLIEKYGYEDSNCIEADDDMIEMDVGGLMICETPRSFIEKVVSGSLNRHIESGTLCGFTGMEDDDFMPTLDGYF